MGHTEVYRGPQIGHPRISRLSIEILEEKKHRDLKLDAPVNYDHQMIIALLILWKIYLTVHYKLNLSYIVVNYVILLI